MNDPITFLAARAGRYVGAGVSHDSRDFTGILIIDPPLNPATLTYRFTATAADGALLHTEVACLGRRSDGVIEIVHANNNINGLQHFSVDTADDHNLVLRHGDLADRQAFREIVRLRFDTSARATLSYDWAMPGGTITPQSWCAMLKQQDNAVTTQRVFPTLRMTDEARSRHFYLEGLGFTIDWEHRFSPDHPLFMQIAKAGLAIRLSAHEGDAKPGGVAHLDVDDVDRWYDHALAHGINTDRPPMDQPWGVRDVRFRDPDGNQLVVATRRR
ncbi:glyoxalase superfamily protein [Acidiphilium sp.]|uniref:glyoxalase superfamily protein n=1 Tax=Acidiphilium sp. TaxID=527 RepID=UPI003D04875A